jgi:hypothetical protein
MIMVIVAPPHQAGDDVVAGDRFAEAAECVPVDNRGEQRRETVRSRLTAR